MRAVPAHAGVIRGHLLTGGRVVTPAGVLSPGWLRVTGSVIDAVGPGEPDERQSSGLTVTDLRRQWVLPGFVDMHVHGGGGTSFTEGTADDARAAAEFHRRHGSTTIVASLVTAPFGGLEARAAMLAGLALQDVIAGLHLEGPFLSAARCGAQDPRYMIAPDVAAFERLHAAAAEVMSAVASVWPMAATTPAWSAALMRAVAPGSSGATVMTRNHPAAAACRRSKAAMSGTIMYRGS